MNTCEQGADPLGYTEGATDKELAHVNLDYVFETYGYPHMVGHRHSLANGLYNGCLLHPEAITFHFSATTSPLTFSPRPSFLVTPRDPSIPAYKVEADLILGADGIKSATRQAMLKEIGAVGEVLDTTQAAYRILLHRSQLAHDPELLALVSSEKVTRWIGERRHLIAYPISSNTIYNISTTQPDVNFAGAPNSTYTTKADKKVMLNVFSDFAPVVRRLLDLAPEGEVCEWKLRIHEPLPTWVHGSVALVGDACHPTLPHLAQGAAQAIEDAAVLGVVLGKLLTKEIAPTPESINRCMRVYEKIRKERAEKLVEWAAASARELHLAEGREKEERDRVFEEARKKGGKSRVPDKWADSEVQKVVYGVDVWKDAEGAFAELYKSLE